MKKTPQELERYYYLWWKGVLPADEEARINNSFGVSWKQNVENQLGGVQKAHYAMVRKFTINVQQAFPDLFRDT